jgi:hypothetical protein
MQLPSYFVRFEDVRLLTVEQFAEKLASTPKKVVGSVSIAELCAPVEYPNGLYFYYDEKNFLQYIGKASSRSFVERIPSHFDQRFDAWFNTLPRRLMQRQGFTEYLAAHARALEMQLVFLGIKSPGTKTINKLETLLRSYLQPALNAGKKGRFPADTLLSSFEA